MHPAYLISQANDEEGEIWVKSSGWKLPMQLALKNDAIHLAIEPDPFSLSCPRMRLCPICLPLSWSIRSVNSLGHFVSSMDETNHTNVGPHTTRPKSCHNCSTL